MCNSKCGWCVLCKYDEAREKQYPSWTRADAVKEAGCYWHWDGDKDCSPEIVYIQYSGSRGVYFASMGQLGWTEAQDVLDMGGWWKRVPHPSNEELRKLLEAEVRFTHSSDDELE